VEILANAAGAYQVDATANRVVGSFSLDASAATNDVDAGAVTGQTADLTISDLGGADGFDSLAEGETATASITLTSEDGTAEAVSTLTITGVNDGATISAAPFESDAAGGVSSSILLQENAAVGGTEAADAFAISDVDYGEQEFSASSVKQTVSILADSAGVYQVGGTAGRVVGSFSLDASAVSNTVDAGALTGQTADLTITDLGGAVGFESLAAGETAMAAITLTSEDGTATAVSNLTITGVNDGATITASGFVSDAAGDTASSILLSETAAVDGKSAADAFAISDVDYGEQEFSASSVKQTVSILANSGGAYQVGGTANRVVGSFSLDASTGSNTVDAGALTGQTADLTITDLGGAVGFESLAAGETATAAITLTSEDGTATAVSNLTITGVNDGATITAGGFESDAAGDTASSILLSETAAAGGRSAADAFVISDVDYGEQEFRTASQTVNIVANSAGAYQAGGTANRVVGSFTLDASTGSNTVDAGALTGQTADLTITDLGGAVGFESLAADETATASITLTSEDGTATTVSNLTITGVNDGATITTSAFQTAYQQSDFAGLSSISYADRYQVSDVDYGQQEFSSGKYTATIIADGSGDALGSFSIVSDGSSRPAGAVLRDDGSQNDDSSDVVISLDPSIQTGQVFNLGAVLDGIDGNSYGVALKSSSNGGRGDNNLYDLSDLSVGSSGYGHLEVYRYAFDPDGKIIDGAWSADTGSIDLDDPIRLIGGANSLADGQTARATLSVTSEDGTAQSAPVTVTVVGSNDAPVVDTSRQLRSFELYGTFTVAEMLGFVDPNKTLITDVDYGSMPESIAVTKLTPTGNFADADTGTLQRYDATTDEWIDVDIKSVSESNKLLLKPSDLLRFNASAEAYVSTVLDKGSSDGGGIFDVEFRAWDSAFADSLADNSPASADLGTLFSSGLQTISLALATTGERANATDLTYIPGQAIGIDGTTITVDGDLNIQTPVKGSVAGAGSSVYDNAVALVDGTSFGGIHGVGNANNIIAAGDTVINAQAEGLVSVDASNYFDSFDDATDADATARLGIKSGPVGSGLVANGAFGVRDVDLDVGANLDLTGVVLGQTQATSRSMDGRAHAGSQFSSSAGIANTEAVVGGDMDLVANGGILTSVEAFSRNGSALADSVASAAYGVVSGLKGSDTSFDVGGAFEGQAGLDVVMKTKASMVGDGVDNANGFSFDDEVIADTKIGTSFGFGTLSSGLPDLAVDVKDTLALSVDNRSLLDTQALAVTGDATASGQAGGNIGIYRTDLHAGAAGEVDVTVSGQVVTLAETTTGDVFAKGYGLHTAGIEASDFEFKDPNSSLSVDVRNAIDARALTKQGGATSLIASSSAGMLGTLGQDVVQSVERVNVLVQDQGFSQAAGISGTGASASAQQSATGISGYALSTTEAMVLDVANSVDSQAAASIVQWA
jgi:VCBS repeat-containing protein